MCDANRTCIYMGPNYYYLMTCDVGTKGKKNVNGVLADEMGLVRITSKGKAQNVCAVYHSSILNSKP